MMFNFKKKASEDIQISEMKKEMQETKERFFAFIGKLEDKLNEFTTAALPELKELNSTDTDAYKSNSQRMQSAVLGQLESVMTKARDVQEEKITCFSHPDTHQATMAYMDFRGECYERFSQLEDLHSKCTQKIENTYFIDYEAKYRSILDDYETVKDKFCCQQCGSPIIIDQIFFTTTYVTCQACQTRNTFEPSSQAKSLELVARHLAEQRTAHLLSEHDKIPQKVQDLYLQRHDIEISLIHEKQQTVIDKKNKQMQELESQQKELENKEPLLYKIYLRAMFDEWNKLNPALSQEHEKFHTSLLNNYNK